MAIFVNGLGFLHTQADTTCEGGLRVLPVFTVVRKPVRISLIL